jgi:hypothetical protein
MVWTVIMVSRDIILGADWLVTIRWSPMLLMRQLRNNKAYC